MSLSASPPRPSDPLLKSVLWLFAGTMVFSVAGMLLLMLVPASLAFFGPYLTQLVVAPTWTYMALLPVIPMLMYAPLLGWKRLFFFLAWGAAVGGASELVGTTRGMPFGEYMYTAWLGPKIIGHVPYFIPLSWFAMSIISLDLARRLADRQWTRILTATAFMVLWDVSLDPAMNGAGTSPVGGVDMFWMYPQGGFYYGMPLSNWIGWTVVSLGIMAGYELLGGGLPKSHDRAPLVYLLNCLFPLVLCLLYGLYLAVAVGALATAVPLVLVRYRGAPAEAPVPSASPVTS